MGTKKNPIVFVNADKFMVKEIEDYTTWRTAGGKEIPINEMATSHILNSIKKIKYSNWRTDWLPYLEKELARRNMYVTSSDRDSRMISEKEMCYFLETSCDGQIINGKEDIVPKINTSISEYLKEFCSLIFVIPITTDKDKFIEEFIDDLRGVSENVIFSTYGIYRLDDVFEIEWKNFIDLMLGRKEKNE